MRRRISGFHQDDRGDWVADLDCLHAQHVRHRPPFQERPWVLSEEGRSERIGSELDCPYCDRAEMPGGLRVIRTAGPFGETTLPAGLRRVHRVAAGTWGRLRVLHGSVGFSMATDPPIDRDLKAGDNQAIPPQVDHQVVPAGPFQLQIDFLAPPSTEPRRPAGR
jgi:tellurite methyltransferase